MRYLILLLIMVGSFDILGDPPDTNITQDTVQSNDAINAPTSVMQNTQVNSGVTHDSYGGGVSCARTTLQAGVIKTNNGVYDQPQMYVGFNMPLGGSDCGTAAQKQISLTHQRTQALKEQVRRENESHNKEMRSKDLKYADLLAKVCLNFHHKLTATEGSTLAEECKQYSPMHKIDQVPLERVAPHKH